MIDLLLARLWRLSWYAVHLGWLYGRHWFTQARLATRGVWIGFYYGHLRVWLELLGLVPSLTWTQIEADRLRLSARCGCELARPEGLEEGLRLEQEARSREVGAAKRLACQCETDEKIRRTI